jgi:predicted Zn-dependent protease
LHGFLPDGCNGKHAVVLVFRTSRGRLLASALLFWPLTYVRGSEALAEQSHRAKELMAERRYAEAIPIYEQLVKALPGNPGLLLDLGLAEHMAGQPGKAIPQFQAVLKLQPDNVPALTSLAMAALQTNQARLALAPLEKLIRLQPADKNVRGMLAGAEMSLGQFETAATQYRKLSAIDASDPKAWYGLGKAYEALASRTFHRLSTVAPKSPYVAVLLADTRLQRKQYRSAFFFYRQAAAQMPALPGLHTGLALVYENTNHPDWAAAERSAEQRVAPDCKDQASRRVSTRQPERPRHISSAECKFLHGDLLGAATSGVASGQPAGLFWATRAYNRLAVEAFDHLGKLPESVEIHALKAQIFHDHRQDPEAVEEWRAALALAPGDPNLESELATALFTAHKYEDAIPLLRKLLAQRPDAPDLNFMLGESLWRMQQPNQAVPYLTTALRGDPNLLPAHAALGMVYALLHRNAEAVPHLEKALSLDDDGSLHYSLARAYQAAGNSAQARKAMQEYQQIRQKNEEINGELAKEAEITAP